MCVCLTVYATTHKLADLCVVRPHLGDIFVPWTKRARTFFPAMTFFRVLGKCMCVFVSPHNSTKPVRVCMCVQYRTGETASSSTCSSQHYVTVKQQPVGYIISDVTQTTGVGSERCPWLVVARRGQRVRVTLYDLTTSPSSPWPGQRQSAQPHEGRCLLYATLREGLEADVIGDHMICSGGGTREQVVYTSRDNTLAITIHYAPASRFILQYEGLCSHVCTERKREARRETTPVILDFL